MGFQFNLLVQGFIAASLLLAVSPLLGQAQTPPAPQEEKPISIVADTLSTEQAGDVVEAKGNVQIRRDPTVLKADEVRMNRKTQDVEAKGNVTMEDPQGWLKAESARLNLENETGEIQNAEIFFEQNHLSTSGERIQKLTGQAYHIDKGFFTTCLCESGAPSWKISAAQIDLEREGKGIIRGGTFYILDVPVFYLPYAAFPVRSERQTGFLFPKIGSSNRDGFKYHQPFFWAISKSSDATLSAVLETETRIGAMGEYRTILRRDTDAQINLSYFNETWREDRAKDIIDRAIADKEIPKNRWSVIGSHRDTSSRGWLTYGDVAAFSDDLFTREMLRHFDLDSEAARTLKTSRYSRSRFGLVRFWKDVEFLGEWAFYQDFIQEDNRTFHKTPQALLKGNHWFEGIPLEFGWRAEGINYIRKEGPDGLRLDLRPEVVLPFHLDSYLFGAFKVAPRQTLYHLYRTEGAFDRNKSRELVEIRGQIGTALERVFSVNHAQLEKVKHVFEPEVSYLFVPDTEQRDIPIMDATDRIRRRNVLNFAVTNRFRGRVREPVAAQVDGGEVELLASPGASATRDLGEIRIGLSYDIDKERKGGDSLSDLDVSLRLSPVSYLNWSMEIGLDPGPWQISQGAAVFSLHDPRPITRRVLDKDFMQPNRIDFSYRFLRKNFLSPLADDANLTTLPDEKLITQNTLGSLRVGTLLHLTDHLLFRFHSDYDVREGRSNNNGGSLKILSRCECWALTLGATHGRNPNRTNFDFEFTILGLGSQNQGLGSAGGLFK